LDGCGGRDGGLIIGALLLVDSLLNLAAMDGNAIGRIEAQPHPIASYTDDGHFDVAGDTKSFAAFSAED
jgi:hypothetical protein